MSKLPVLVGFVLLPAILLGLGTPAHGQGKYPAWDGKESVAEYAKRAQLEPTLAFDLGGGVKLDLVLIPAGSFVMGSPDGEAQGEDKGKEKQHKVALTQPYYLGKFELTQAQYEKVAGKNPSQTKGDNLPVTQVTWAEAMAFCQKLGAQVKRKVALPTEAQWEHACRAGTKTTYYTGNTEADLGKAGWYGNNSDRKIHPVGEKLPNAWGLYDMHGNVRDYCLDFMAPVSGADAVDPKGPASGTTHVVRGGAFTSNPGVCRSAVRRPIENLMMTGFRVAVIVGND